jgi:hypothetical protein
MGGSVVSSMGGGGATGGSAGACSDNTPAPTITRTCRPATDNECDGQTANGFKPEGAFGNGFDDDCDGLVDEGCSCSNVGVGAVKDCFLLPSTQTTGGPDYQVVGWCDPSSRGKLTCITVGNAEFANQVWSGECKGAQPPFAEDVCAAGDFDCDGVELDPPGGCACKPPDPVVCPGPLYTRPFPDPMNVGQFTTDPTVALVPGAPLPVDGIDGHGWIDANVMDPSSTTNWRWTVTGGPCDDILPHPTFGVFSTAQTRDAGGNDLWDAHLGTERVGLPISPARGQPDPTVGDPGAATVKQGFVLEAAPAKIYPAFSLSGDYYVTGKFDYPDPNDPAKTVEGQCTQIVKVRAGGLRVELCWPEVGTNRDDNDVDLHVARLQGNPAGDGKHGWFTTAGLAPQSDDCYYSPCSACGNRTDASYCPSHALTPGWYENEVTDEPGGVGVCHGWGSRRFDGSVTGTQPRPCTSPRLDRDNLACDPSEDNPNAPEVDPLQQADPAQVPNAAGIFCGPENVNLDSQVLQPQDRFAVGVQCYDCIEGSNGVATKAAHPRVNIYCNGELSYSFGYDPGQLMTNPDQYPQLWTEGSAYHGSMWNVAQVTWTGDVTNPCQVDHVEPTGAWNGDDWHTKSNGSPFLCVNNGPLNVGGGQYAPEKPVSIDWRFRQDGAYPSSQADLCSY